MTKKYVHHMHNQYISYNKWTGMMQEAVLGLAMSFSDGARYLYNLLWTDFIELTHEVARLWHEVQHLRALDKVNVARIEELERAGFSPKVCGRFTSSDNVQCEAVPLHWLRMGGVRPACGDEFTSQDGRPLKVVEKEAWNNHSDGYFELQRLKEGNIVNQQRLIDNAAFHSRERELNKLRDDVRVFRVERDKAISERDMAVAQRDAQAGGFKGVELTMDVRGNEVTGRVYELEGMLSERRLGMLAMKKVVVPMPKPNITYGIDFGRGDDHTVVTIKQNGVPLFSIDMEEAKKRHQWRMDLFAYATLPTFLRPHGPVISDGVLRSARVAEHVAIRAEARKRIEEWQRTRRSDTLDRHNVSWRRDEDERLERMYKQGYPLRRLALELGREWEAILYRLARLSRWPTNWLRSTAFLDFAWLWFFTPQGGPLFTSEKRLDRLNTLPKNGDAHLS